MNPLPSSLVAAILCSAAAGKNPWVPLGLISLVAAPERLPAFLLSPEIHAKLHSMAPPSVLWGVGALMGVLALLESFGDKIPGVEQWLVPLSSSWRPFAGLIVASIIAWAGIPVAPGAMPAELTASAQSLGGAQVSQADLAAVSGIGAAALTILAGTFAGYLATVGKSGVRLMLSLVPIPGLKLAHSFLDDIFAVFATGVGLAFADTTFVAILALLYLFVGLFTGPFLARLAGIYLRIMWSLWRKAVGDAARLDEVAPAWLERHLARQRSDGDADAELHDAVLFRAYSYRAPGVGWARHGYLVLNASGARFVAKKLFGASSHLVPAKQLARLGLAETATIRSIEVCDAAETPMVQTWIHLFPADAARVQQSLERGVRAAGLEPVKPESESARSGLPGAQALLDDPNHPRYRPASAAGDLRAQALTTIIAAVITGVLTMGTFIPVGAGYAYSAFPKRLVLSLLLSLYLMACAVGTAFTALPVTIAYAVVLNLVALRDMTRNAVRARTEGFVDKRAFLPLVSHRVFIPRARLRSPSDIATEQGEAMLDGPWRAVAKVLATG